MTYRIIGFTDSINECDCCGKTELKGVYVIADELDNELYFGRICGAKAAKIDVKTLENTIKTIKTNKELENAVKNAKSKYDECKIIKSLNRLGITINDFILKYGRFVETINNFSVYEFGNKTYNIVNNQ